MITTVVCKTWLHTHPSQPPFNVELKPDFVLQHLAAQSNSKRSQLDGGSRGYLGETSQLVTVLRLRVLTVLLTVIVSISHNHSSRLNLAFSQGARGKLEHKARKKHEWRNHEHFYQ